MAARWLKVLAAAPLMLSALSAAPAQALVPYVGSYEIAQGMALEVSAVGSTLYMQAPGQPKVEMEDAEDGSYAIPMAGATITFEKDDSGAVIAMVMSRGGNETRAVKR